uniref:LysR substrate-binding domain-containing protein n=1 Tax=Phenylobacterium glaciei TaxID=2803784 RepID=A0A974P4F5_9CAUL|nr:hypothetical protein JKL49_02425 [Phenylobacterium glaciei]
MKIDLIVSDVALDLASGEADVAIRSGIALTVSDLVARKLADFDFALYCSRDYAARRGVLVNFEDLKNHDLIGGDGSHLPLPGMRWMFERAGGVEPAHTSNSMTNLNIAVKAGLGIAPVGCLLADLDPDLIQCSEPIPELRAGSWVVTRPELKDAPRVRAFIDFIVPTSPHCAAAWKPRARPSGRRRPPLWCPSRRRPEQLSPGAWGGKGARFNPPASPASCRR